eukprot:tig00000540_g1931.t1
MKEVRELAASGNSGEEIRAALHGLSEVEDRVEQARQTALASGGKYDPSWAVPPSGRSDEAAVREFVRRLMEEPLFEQIHRRSSSHEPFYRFICARLDQHPDPVGAYWTSGTFMRARPHPFARCFTMWHSEALAELRVRDFPWNEEVNKGCCPGCEKPLYTAFRLGGGTCGRGHSVCIDCMSFQPMFRRRFCCVCEPDRAGLDESGMLCAGVPYAWDQLSVNLASASSPAASEECARRFEELLGFIRDGMVDKALGEERRKRPRARRSEDDEDEPLSSGGAVPALQGGGDREGAP